MPIPVTYWPYCWAPESEDPFPTRLNFSETPVTYGAYTEPSGLGKTFEVKVMPQAVNFAYQILPLAAALWRLWIKPLHMQRMVRFEAEM
jgi:hypothetical protein